MGIDREDDWVGEEWDNMGSQKPVGKVVMEGFGELRNCNGGRGRKEVGKC